MLRGPAGVSSKQHVHKLLQQRETRGTGGAVTTTTSRQVTRPASPAWLDLTPGEGKDVAVWRCVGLVTSYPTLNVIGVEEEVSENYCSHSGDWRSNSQVPQPPATPATLANAASTRPQPAAPSGETRRCNDDGKRKRGK
ncbi:hypothetical protein E2C01_088176 [Portunus trituberculatus]|uniref:Uncharacterized protein n=1 Tax=Portunus trituberculatus TaxID=210409 RepID=A0A5B7J8I0_PORTR|nr:hypothetical protein [Portunus trituberculatus]